MKIKLLIICLLVAFTARAQTVTPNPGPYQNISTKYQYTWQKWTGGIWNLGKLVQQDSAQFNGITYVPTAPAGDSSLLAANTRWIKENISPGVPGQPTAAWSTTGNYIGSGSNKKSIGTIDSIEWRMISNSQVRLLMPANGIKRRTDAIDKYLVMDTTTKELYYTDGGSGGGSSSGITSLGSGWGLNNVNDSTYEADSLVVATQYGLSSGLAGKQDVFGNQSAWNIYGNHTSGSAAPTFGKLNINSIDATGTPSGSTVLYGNGTWGTAPAVGWSLTGNAGIDSSTNYLGTSDLKPFQIKTNGITRILLTQDGKTTITSPYPIGFGYINLVGNTNITGRLVLVTALGTLNTAIGHTALNSVNGSSGNNIGIGYDAGYSITGGTGNVILGRSSFIFLAGNQSYNIGLGYQTGYSQTAGSYNIAIGAGANLPTSTGSGQLNIGNVIYGINLRQNAAGSSTAQTNGRIGINTNAPDASAALDLTSTTMGLLIPRMTTTQKNAISSPANGLSVYDTDTKQPNYYDGVTWKAQVGMTFGTAAPAITPAAVGNFFLDTTNKKLYVSTGTASSADWNILN